MHFYEIVSSTCELSYNGVTGSKNNEYAWHFETEISGSNNQEIS